MDPNGTSLVHIPSDLITGLHRVIGVEASLKTLPSNSKLHRAWQAAVEKVTINHSVLRADDVNTLAKLVNLGELNFKGSAAEAEQTSHPAWHIIVCAAPRLTRLKKISLVDIPEEFQVLRSMAGMEGLVHRLEALEIRDGSHIISANDLCALRSLTALRTLSVDLQSVQPSEMAPHDLGKQLSLLRDLEFITEVGADCDLTILPGSLTSLTSLTLLCAERDLGDEELDVKLLADAASKLTGLCAS
jgi:hypothetical protein